MSKTRNLSKVLALVIMLALVIGILPMGAMAATSVTINKTSRTLTDLSGSSVGTVSVSGMSVSGVSDAVWEAGTSTSATIIVSLVPGSTASGTLAATITPTSGSAQSTNITVTSGEGTGTITVNSVPYTIRVQSTEAAYTGSVCYVGAVAGEGVTLGSFSGSGTSSSPYTATASAEVTGYPFKMSLRIIPDGTSYGNYSSYSYTVLDSSDSGTGLTNYVGTYFLAEYPANNKTLRFSVTNGAGVTTYYAITLSAQGSTGSGSASLYAYLPAPGQFTNEGVTTGGWGDAYTSAGALKINTTTGISLGYYGGYAVYQFDDPVVNNVQNPFGADFIVYGNGFWANSEPGAIQVAQGKPVYDSEGAVTDYVIDDVNNDGVIWYDIAGSQYYSSNTEYASIIYTNPNTTEDAGITTPATNQGTRAAVSYSLTGATSGTSTATVAVNPFHNHSWWPLYANYFKDVTGRDGTAKIASFPFITSSPATPSQTSVSSTLTFTGQRLITVATTNTAGFPFGYADVHGTGTLGGTVAYNPYAIGSASITNTSTYTSWLSNASYTDGQASGGDPIDISWAVYPKYYDTGTNAGSSHPMAGQPVPTDQLPNVVFVRIYTGAALNNGINGELSTEVCGIAPVSGSGSGVATSTTTIKTGTSTRNLAAVTTSNMGTYSQSFGSSANTAYVQVTSDADYIYVNGELKSSGTNLSFDISSGTKYVQIITQNGTESPYITVLKLSQ